MCVCVRVVCGLRVFASSFYFYSTLVISLPILFLFRYFYQTFRPHWNSVSFPQILTHFYRNIRTHSCVCVCVCVCCRCVVNKLLTIAKLAFCLLTFCYALLQLQRRELTNCLTSGGAYLTHTYTCTYTQRVRRMRECAGMWVAAWLNVCEWGTREQERERQCVCV